MKVITTGVYGDTEESFFQKLIDEDITLFVDVRLRRGMRGSKYKFVNSTYLQEKLATLDIKYLHIKDLAPTKEIRALQKVEDNLNQISKQEREGLSDVFIDAYQKEILNNFDLSLLIDELKDQNSVLFCVEEKACACHRSLVLSAIENFMK